jgi:integrase
MGSGSRKHIIFRDPRPIIQRDRAHNHSFRATGITAYLSNGGTLEHAQEMAGHESPRTTKLYDRTKERLTQDEVERIRL